MRDERQAMAVIGFLVTDPTGGVAHYRAAVPANMLRARGHTVVVSDIAQQTPAGTVVLGLQSPDEYDGPPVAWEPDVIILTGGWPSAIELEWLDDARAEGQRVVCDVDDLPWIPPDNVHHDAALPRAKFDAFARSDHVIASTPYLAHRVRDHVRGVPVTVARNVVERSLFDDARATNDDPNRLHVAPLRVGWRGGTEFHAFDLALLRGAFDALDVELVHVGHRDGAPTFASLVGVDPSRVVLRPLVPFGHYPAQLADVDLAVIPLANRPFSWAKSCVAGQEWNAAGVPFVASHTGEYDRITDAVATTARDLRKLIARYVRGGVSMRRALFERQSLALHALPYDTGHHAAAAGWEQVLDELGARADANDAGANPGADAIEPSQSATS